MAKSEDTSTFRLIIQYLRLARSFFSKEKSYAKQVVQDAVKTSVPGLVLGIAGLVLIALAGIFSLVTLVLVLNTWFLPWASALFVTTLLLVCGLILGLIGLRMAKKGIDKARTDLGKTREDMRWLKKR